MKKICICGKEFESKTGKARYCSQKCRFKGYYQTHKELWHFNSIKNENKIAKKEQKKIDDEKNAMLQKRRSDIDLLKKRMGIDNYALVAYYYDTDKIDELLKIAKYRQDNGLIKIRNKDEQRIVKSHGGKITGGFDYFMISTN